MKLERPGARTLFNVSTMLTMSSGKNFHDTGIQPDWLNQMESILETLEVWSSWTMTSRTRQRCAAPLADTTSEMLGRTLTLSFRQKICRTDRQ
jgi:hypothetical protein